MKRSSGCAGESPSVQSLITENWICGSKLPRLRGSNIAIRTASSGRAATIPRRLFFVLPLRLGAEVLVYVLVLVGVILFEFVVFILFLIIDRRLEERTVFIADDDALRVLLPGLAQRATLERERFGPSASSSRRRAISRSTSRYRCSTPAIAAATAARNCSCVNSLMCVPVSVWTQPKNASARD